MLNPKKILKLHCINFGLNDLHMAYGTNCSLFLLHILYCRLNAKIQKIRVGGRKHSNVNPGDVNQTLVKELQFLKDPSCVCDSLYS